jgi:hypothetical protein
LHDFHRRVSWISCLKKKSLTLRPSADSFLQTSVGLDDTRFVLILSSFLLGIVMASV